MHAEAVSVAIRLRRFWLEKVITSPEFLASDLAGEHDIRLRRVADQLVVSGRLDFGLGDPFADELGDLVRDGLASLSHGTVKKVTWQRECSGTPMRRSQSSDLDVLDPGDPPASAYAVVAGHLRRAYPEDLSEEARETLHAVRLSAVSRHRLWFAVETRVAAAAIGLVPGARGALVGAVQRYQGHELPLYRIVIDKNLGRAGQRL